MDVGYMDKSNLPSLITPAALAEKSRNLKQNGEATNTMV